MAKKPNNYGIDHRPSDEGAPLHDLTQAVPADVYDRPDWYTGFPELLGDTAAAIRRLRGNPDKSVRVFRAGPARELNPGDWVSLSKEYTKQHEAREGGGAYRTCVFSVQAKDVRFAGDDLMEWGYFGPKLKVSAEFCSMPKRTRKKPAPKTEVKLRRPRRPTRL